MTDSALTRPKGSLLPSSSDTNRICMVMGQQSVEQGTGLWGLVAENLTVAESDFRRVKRHDRDTRSVTVTTARLGWVT